MICLMFGDWSIFDPIGVPVVYQLIDAKWNRWLEIGVAVAEVVVLVAFAMPVWATIKIPRLPNWDLARGQQTRWIEPTF